MKAQVALVVPCRDEARRFDVEAFAAHMERRPADRLVLVDHGSVDGTGDVLAALAGRFPARAERVRLPRTGTKDVAVRAGLRAALGHEPRFVGYWDADLATPLNALDRLEAVLEVDPSLDGALASRVRLLGRTVHRRPFRHLVGRLFASAISLAMDWPVYDTQCGAKLLRPSPALDAALASPFTTGWLFDAELLLRIDAMGRGGRRFREVPLERWVDVSGSKVGPVGGLRSAVAAIRLLRIRQRLNARRRPASGS